MTHDLTYNMTEYVVTCVSEFSRVYNISMQQAYAYLSRFKAIDFLLEFYDVEHTLSIDNAVEDMRDICLRNGGRLA